MVRPIVSGPPRADVFVIGGANRDEVMRLAGPLAIGASNRVRTEAVAGGIARNVAQNLAALGVVTRLLTAVGDDGVGEWLLKETKTAGVDVTPSVKRAGMSTGRYIAVLDGAGDLAVGLADMEAVESLGAADIEANAHAFAEALAVFLDTNLLASALSAAIAAARAGGTTLMVDLVSPVKAQRLADVAGVDIIVGNCNEASALLDRTGSAEELAQAIVERGAGSAVVSDAAAPLGWCDGTGSGTLAPPELTVVDVTGAGDALHAGILAAHLKGASLERAAERGLRAAATVAASKHHALIAPESAALAGR